MFGKTTAMIRSIPLVRFTTYNVMHHQYYLFADGVVASRLLVERSVFCRFGQRNLDNVEILKKEEK